MTFVYQRALAVIHEMSNGLHLSDSFAKIIVFLSQNPESANYLRGDAPASEAYMRRMAASFIKSRQPQRPSMPSTVPDDLIGLILSACYGVAEHDQQTAIDMHMKAMGAENIIGNLLERYIASELEPRGWVWCSAPFVKSIDFIKPDPQMRTWELLQVKNRDNSENSSSSAVRSGTRIQKWFRTYSQTGASNWENFPDAQGRTALSATSFREFVRHYLSQC